MTDYQEETFETSDEEEETFDDEDIEMYYHDAMYTVWQRLKFFLQDKHLPVGEYLTLEAVHKFTSRWWEEEE
jgi:hypothetical protein